MAASSLASWHSSHPGQAEAAEFLGETRQALELVRARLWPQAR
jgi:hypothetical protein